MQHRARKRFGQNFLQSFHVIEQIVSAVAPQSSDNLVEIGPGLGAITQPLLAHLTHLTAIEIDVDLIDHLKAQLQSHLPHQLSILEADALKFDYQTLYQGRPLRIVGNLPYNISTPLLFKLLENRPLIRDCHFMLQKEVVDRMSAQPNTAAYGRLSVMLQYHCQVDALFDIPPSAFKPQPKVTSSFARLTMHQTLNHRAVDEKFFACLVREAFNHRRKMLSSSLKRYLSPEDLSHCGVPGKARPENLSLHDFIRLSNHLSKRSS